MHRHIIITFLNILVIAKTSSAAAPLLHAMGRAVATHSVHIGKVTVPHVAHMARRGVAPISTKAEFPFVTALTTKPFSHDDVMRLAATDYIYPTCRALALEETNDAGPVQDSTLEVVSRKFPALKALFVLPTEAPDVSHTITADGLEHLKRTRRLEVLQLADCLEISAIDFYSSLRRFYTSESLRAVNFAGCNIGPLVDKRYFFNKDFPRLVRVELKTPWVMKRDFTEKAHSRFVASGGDVSRFFQIKTPSSAASRRTVEAPVVGRVVDDSSPATDFLMGYYFWGPMLNVDVPPIGPTTFGMWLRHKASESGDLTMLSSYNDYTSSSSSYDSSSLNPSSGSLYDDSSSSSSSYDDSSSSSSSSYDDD